MDDWFPNFQMNLGDTQEFSNSQYYENSPFFSNPTQAPNTENLETSQNTEKQPRGNKWDTAEDIALMSAWCFASNDSEKGKNKKKKSLWAQIKELYDDCRAENPEKYKNRNEDQMRGRWKRLNENANKWVGAYREAWRRKTSGMSQKDIEKDAHKIYEASGNKFNDLIVFNEVMCKNKKWALELDRETTRSRPEGEVGEEESGGSTKRSRTTEEGDFCVHSNPETPTSGGSTINRPTGRDAAKKKGKGKASNEVVAELRAMRITRENEFEFMKKKLDLDQEKEIMKMHRMHLNTLLQKEHLSPEEENMKSFLMSKYYGN